MIVTRAKAEEAAALLGIRLDVMPCAEEISHCYKQAAKSAHPDTGGSAEAFARVDWAKHALLAWLRQQGGAATAAEHSVFQRARCDACNGSGRVTMRKGWSTLQVACTKCHGSGDANYDAEKVDHGR